MVHETLFQQTQQDFQQTQQDAPITGREEHQELYYRGNCKESHKR